MAGPSKPYGNQTLDCFNAFDPNVPERLPLEWLAAILEPMPVEMAARIRQIRAFSDRKDVYSNTDV
jgi:hypothetical protein